MSGVDFDVKLNPCRVSDPASLIAGADTIRTVIGWIPRNVDLETISRTASAYEKHLIERSK